MELEKTTPYMLRNDGELLSCGDIHPYIKMYFSADYHENLKTLILHRDFLDWFISNSRNPETVKIVSVLKDKINTNDTANIESLFNTANDLTNQEFCRVRTSNFKYKYGGDNGEIYFRISSKNFNWFNLIWVVVNKFKNQIKFVTIMKDLAAFGKQFEYIKDGKNSFNKMPVDEFLTLPGNPVAEDLNMNEDIEKHETLNPKLFDGDKLKPEVIERCKQITDEFIEDLKTDNIDLDIKDIILTGSNASYNYTKDSDIDLHIIADMSKYSDSELESVLPVIYDAFRKNWKSKYTIKFYDIPVELFVETTTGDEE